MKVLSFMNPKGGVGKTVSAISFSYALVNKGYKVLLIDTDPRSAVEIFLGIESPLTINELLQDFSLGKEVNLEKYVNKKNGLDIIVSSYYLSKFPTFFNSDMITKTFIFKNLVESVSHDYDYILFDTEGTVNELTTSVLFGTNQVFIPTQASSIDLIGIRDILEVVSSAQKQNNKLEIKKVFLVRAKQKTNSYKLIKEKLLSFFEENQFSEISIRENQDIVNAMNEELDIFSYKPNATAAQDYRNLVEEYLKEE